MKLPVALLPLRIYDPQMRRLRLIQRRNGFIHVPKRLWTWCGSNSNRLQGSCLCPRSWGRLNRIRLDETPTFHRATSYCTHHSGSKHSIHAVFEDDTLVVALADPFGLETVSTCGAFFTTLYAAFPASCIVMLTLASTPCPHLLYTRGELLDY